MTTLEKDAQNFINTNKAVGAYKGTYVHKNGNYLIYVLHSTPKYVTLKWGETEVVRSVSFMIDYEKLEKTILQ